MDSLTYYNLAVKDLNVGSQKETEKRYGEAKEHYEMAMEYFMGALNRESAFFINQQILLLFRFTLRCV